MKSYVAERDKALLGLIVVKTAESSASCISLLSSAEADSEYQSESEMESRASSHDMTTEEIQKTGSDTSSLLLFAHQLHPNL